MLEPSYRFPEFVPASGALRALVALTLLFGAAGLSQAIPQQSEPFVQRAEEELLLLEVVLDREVLTPTMPAYPIRGGLLVPMGEMARLLSLAVETDVVGASAEGFLLSEDRRFRLDVRGGTVTIGGQQEAIQPEQVEIHQSDIYVDTRALARWWPVDFKIDLFASQIIVQPREPLPAQVRKARQKLIDSARISSPVAPSYPETPNPFALFDGPFIDQTMRLFSTSSDGAERENGAEFTTYMAGDLLYHQANLFVSGSDHDPFDTVRFTLGRSHPEGRYLGPLNAREYAIGDVVSLGLDQLLLPSSGPGLLVSNYPLRQQSQFDRHTFRGDLPPGWEVELYQNEVLLAYQQSRADGLYLFEDVPLLFGQNLFRLVFHGPQGQKREEIYRFQVGETLVPEGELYYRAVSADPDFSGRRSTFELDYGLRKNLSLKVAVADAETQYGDFTWANVSASVFWRSLFARFGVAAEKDGGTAVQIAAQTRLGPLNFSFEHAELNDFVSEVYRPQFGLIDRRTVLRTDALFRIGRVASVPLSLEVERNELVTGGEAYRLNSRVGGYYRRTFLTHQLQGFVFNGTDSGADSLFGSVLASRQLRTFGLRGEVLYGIEPEREIRAASVTAETYAVPGFVLQSGVFHSLQADRTDLFASANKREGRFAAGLLLTWSDPGGVSVSINLFTGLARDRVGDWIAEARGVAATGAASAFVFLDRNGNGVPDRGEPPIENVGFFINRASTRQVTDETGRAVFTGLPAELRSDIAISPSTLEDPLWKPARAGVSFVARPGKALEVLFPVIATGEITGTVFLNRGGGWTEAPGLRLRLVALEKEEEVASVVTAYDGFYEITGVAPGQYRLQVDRAQAERLGLSGELERDVVITAEGTILDGFDLRLTQR